MLYFEIIIIHHATKTRVKLFFRRKVIFRLPEMVNQQEFLRSRKPSVNTNSSNAHESILLVPKELQKTSKSKIQLQTCKVKTV
jgi:hypothetical protein